MISTGRCRVFLSIRNVVIAKMSIPVRDRSTSIGNANLWAPTVLLVDNEFLSILKSLMVSVNIPLNTPDASHTAMVVSIGICLPILAPISSDMSNPVTWILVTLDNG